MTTVITNDERALLSCVQHVAERPSPAGMINYTDQLTWLMQDIVRRVPALGHIDMSRVLIFARFGRSDAEGAYATCHAISIPGTTGSAVQ